MRLSGLVVALALMAPPVAAAPPIDDAYFAVVKKDYKKAMDLLLPLADQGVVAAQYTVAVIMDGGFGNKDQLSEDAPKWYRRAADQGHPEAQTKLAQRYVEGRGVPQDFGEARKLYLAATRHENREAHFGLAELYSRGLGGPKDAPGAAALCLRAAEQGHIGAQVLLGNLYTAGDGLARDDKEAVRWYARAAEYGHPDGQVALGVAYRDGRGVEENLVLAYVWFAIAARNPEVGGSEVLTQVGTTADLERIAARFPPEVRAEADRIIGNWKAKR